MVQRARGTRDFTPEVMNRRLAFEHLLEQQARQSGFKRVQTPIFEHLDLFTAKSGDGVVSQLYAFQDKSERNLTLRPELTAPVMRMIAEEMRNETKPLRLSYFGQCFRYEESKKGRYREFFQYGIELIGASGPLAEAEVIAVALNMLSECGLQDYEVRIGHVGVLRSALVGIGFSNEAGDDGKEPTSASAMRFLDKADWQGMENLMVTLGIDVGHIEPLRSLAELSGGVETLPVARDILSSLDGVDMASLDELEQLLVAVDLLADAPPSLSVNLCVARGLDYYTGMVFEVHVPELGGEGQVLGGGSYRLLHLFGLEDLDPCCGFGLGFDRVLLALQAQAEAEGRSEVVPGEIPDKGIVAFVPFRIEATEVLPIVYDLRMQGEKVDLELRGRNIGKAFGWADGIGAEFVIIVGPKDLENGQASMKRMADGQQVTIELNAESIMQAINELRA